VLAFAFSAISKTQRVKTPNVSGTFYPADKKALSNMIDTYIDNASLTIAHGAIKGIISPHAGYIYSGPVAGYAYKSLAGYDYKTVVILAPSHHYFLKESIAIYKQGDFRTPLGDVSIDSDFAQSLMLENKYITHQPEVFDKEHSLEVQLPFLQRSLKNFKIVPILIGNDSYSLCQSLASSLAKKIHARNDILIVASSDMSHYHPKIQAYTMDKHTLSLITQFKPQQLFEDARQGASELCGTGAVVSLMLTLQKLGITNASVLKYATSADTAQSSQDRVVGYSSIVFAESKPNNDLKKGAKAMYTDVQKNILLKIARASIVEFIEQQTRLELNENDPVLLEPRGAFVTLKIDEKLRGCIGRLAAEMPLVKTIREMAIEAATGDPRFPPLRKEELEKVSIEISVLSPLKQMFNIDEIEVGKHGLLIRKGFSSGLLLPQVATEYNWTKEEFLQHTCRKAGLGQDAWMSNAQIYIFSAEVFGEHTK